jgi:hypothetical protein
LVFLPVSYRVCLPLSLDSRLVLSIALTLTISDPQLDEPDSLTLVSRYPYFLVLGHPTRCVDYIPTCSSVPPFKRKIEFTVETLDEDVGITLLGLTSSPKTISGLPQTVAELVRTQQLQSPFGRADCTEEDKALPPTPI